MGDVIKNRYEFVYLFDVENGNPNGDPDSGNMPRIDPETSFGIITDVCLKRKIRNFVEIVKKNQTPYCIYIREKAILTSQREPAYKATEKAMGKLDKKANKEAEQIKAAREWMCENFFDVRTFGAVMSTKENNCGQVRGPVQFNFARSIDAIVPLELSITRMAVETAREAETQSGDNRTMGRKHIVPYGLYRSEGYVSAFLAEQTGFVCEDLKLLWQALISMFDHDHSAARGKMNARKLFIFKHDSGLGNAPAHKLFELVTVNRVSDSKIPARSFSDYTIKVNKGSLPAGVSLEEKL